MNDSTTEEIDSKLTSEERGGSAQALILVASMAGLCILLLVIAILACRFANMNLRRSAREALRTQRERLKRLNQTAPPEPFSKWYKEDRKRHPDIPAASFDSQLCIICLEIITGKDSVRALSCRHIYHTACFDKWFKGYHDFCPVCHGRVVPEAESVTV